MYTRRELIKCLMVGGMIIAGKLWIPDSKTIFIPSKRTFFDNKISLLDSNGKAITWIWNRLMEDLPDKLSFGEFHETGIITTLRLSIDDRVIDTKVTAPLTVNKGDGVNIEVDCEFT